jgi:hypothetical protein
MAKNPNEPDSPETVLASAILEKIQKGEQVSYDRVLVKGNLDLSDMPRDEKNKARVACNINITRSKIERRVIFKDIIFERTVNLSATNFNGNVDISRSVFLERAVFEGSKFNRDVLFTGSQFIGRSIFVVSKFNKDALFQGCRFNKNVLFTGSQFIGRANFSRCAFVGGAIFKESRFSEDANFKNSRFDRGADFSQTQFEKFANFGTSQFQYGLTLKDVDFDKIYLSWDGIKNVSRDFDGKVYLSLIESYKTRGFFEDADNCYYDYRNERRIKVLKGGNKKIDNLLRVLYGYGVKPYWPLYWSLGCVFAFSVTYFIAFNSDLLGNMLGVAATIFPLFNNDLSAFNTSLTTFIYGAKLIDNPNFTHPGFYWIFTIEKLLGSLFLLLFFLSFGKTIIR